MSIGELRNEYHQRLCREVIRIKNGYPTFADGSNRTSVQIAGGIVRKLAHEVGVDVIQGQTSGGRFEEITKDFIEGAFGLLHHLRPGQWRYSTHQKIADFDQYAHLAYLQAIVEENSQLASWLGSDYIIMPDIVIGRWPVSDDEINREKVVIDLDDPLSRFTPLREKNIDQMDSLLMMIEGRRRDISDLPFDIAI